MSLDNFLLDLRRHDAVHTPGSPHTETEWYMVRCDGGPAHPVRLPWREGWLADLGHLRNRDYGGAVLARLGDRLSRLLEATEWPMMLRNIQNARREGRKVRLTVSSGAAELLWLPWEALPAGGSGTTLSALLGSTIRYCWPGTGTRPAPVRPHPDGGRMMMVLCGPDAARSGLHQALRAAVGKSGRPRFCDVEQDVVHEVALDGLVKHLERRDKEGRPVTLLHLAAPMGGTAQQPMLHLGGQESAATVVSAGELTAALSRFAAVLRVVVFTPLEGDTQAGTAGRIAQDLHRTGIQMVLAPRLVLTEEGTLRLTEVLHRGMLRRTLPVEAAVHEAVADLERRGSPVDAAAVQVLVRPDSPDWTRPFALRPHRGLAPYDIDDETFFVGRKQEVDEVVGALDALERESAPRIFGIVGAPGLGKTSLALAGVAPALLRRRRDGWRVAVVDPARQPTLGLERALATTHGEGGRLLVVIDGLESLLANDVNDDEKRAFINRVWRLVSSGTSGVTALLTLRVGALGRCSQLPIEDLGQTLDQILYQDRHRCFLAAPGPRAHSLIVTEPARAVGLRLDPALTRRIVQEAQRAPDALTQLSTALDLLWASRTGDTLRLEAYEAIGGLRGAVATACERSWAGLPDDEHRALAKALLCAMVLGRGEHVRPMPVLAASLRPAGGDARRRFDTVVHALEDRGLVIRRFESVDQQLQLGSELVLREWPRLKAWLAPKKVQSVKPTPRRSPPPRRPWVVWMMVVVVVVLAAVVAEEWWGKRSEQRADATARFEAARARHGDPTSAVVLLRQIPPALRPDGWQEAANEALQASHATALASHGAPLRAIDFDGEGSRVLTLSDGVVRVGKVGEPPRALRVAGIEGGAVAAAFVPSGTAVVTVMGTGAVVRWPLDGSKPETLVEGGGAGHAIAAFSPDATHVLVSRRSGWQLIATEGELVTKGTVPVTRDGRTEADVAVAVSNDGTRWAIGTEGGRVVVWDVGQKRPKTHRHDGVKRLSVNSAGTHLLVTGGGGMRIIDLVRGVGSSRTPPSVVVNTATFDADGHNILVDYQDEDRGTRHLRIVALDRRSDQVESGALSQPATALAALDDTLVFRGEGDGSVRQLDGVTGDTVRVLRGHQSRISRLKLSPDGRWLASASLDGQLRVWDVRDQGQALVQLVDPSILGATGAVVASDGAHAAAHGEDGGIRVWPSDDVLKARVVGSADEPLTKLWVGSGYPASVAGLTDDGVLRVWGGEPHEVALEDVVLAVDPGIHRAAVKGPRSDVKLVDLSDEAREPLALSDVAGARRAAFDATGEVLAVGDGQGNVELRSALSGELIRRVEMANGPIDIVCVAPAGARIGAASPSGGLDVWTETHTDRVSLPGMTARARGCAFSADGTRLLVQQDGLSRVWAVDGSSPQELLSASSAVPDLGATARFDGDGGVVTVGDGGELRRWLLDGDALQKRLWAATSTCRLPGEAPVDLTRWCACESCMGREPAECAPTEDGVPQSTLDAPEAWCPG